MRRWLLVLPLLAACSGGGSDSADLTVRIVADSSGLGCIGVSPVGNGSRLVVLDAEGQRVGVGTFQLSEGAETCDWTATVTDVAEGVVTLEGGGEEMAVVDLAADGYDIDLHAQLGGRILVEP